MAVNGGVFVVGRKGKTMTVDTIAIIVSIAIAAAAIIGVNVRLIGMHKTDIAEIRADLRELRGLLIAHVTGHFHSHSDSSKDKDR